MKQGEQVYQRTSTPFVNRDRDQITAFFTGYELLEPGLVTLPRWRPDSGDEPDSDAAAPLPAYGGLGRKAE
jgi:hypothetical protein